MKKIILGILLLAAMAITTQAGVILSDSFTYPDGDVVGAPGSPWQGHSGSLPMQVSSNRLVVNGSIDQDVHADLQGVVGLTSTPYTTNSGLTLYCSFDLNYFVLPSHVFQDGAYIAHFKDNLDGAATGFGGRLWAANTDTSHGALAPGVYRLGIINGAYAATPGNQDVNDSVQLAVDLNTNVTYKIVTSFNLSNGIARLWIDPGSETDPYAEGTDPGTATVDNPMDVYSYAFRQANSGQGRAYVDNLKVGTHFFDVAGTNTPPLISTIAEQSIPANTATPAIAFTVQDDNTPAASLVLSNYSDNPTLVPNDVSHIAFGGSGTNRTITVTPAASQQGLAVIHVYATDNAYTSEGTFNVKVGYPVIASIANQITAQNTATPAIGFTVGDSESSASSLTLARDSSNPTLVPNDASHIAFGGSASNRTVTVTPASGQSGVGTVTVSVSDGARTNSSSFKVTVKQSSVGVLLSDTFSYTGFGNTPSGYPPSLLGADTPPTIWQHASGGFHVITVTNGAAELSFTTNENLVAPLSGQPYFGTNGVVLYSGFKVLFQQLPGSFGNYFATFKDAVTGLSIKSRIFTSTTNAATGQFRLGLANNTANQNVQFSRDLSLNVPYIVVTRHNFATGESWLWVNPVNESSSNVAATDNVGNATVGYYALREASGIGLLDIDNLLIADTFAGVIPSVPSSPPTLNKAVVGSNLVMTWSNPTGLLSLQSAALVDGPYLDITNAVSPYTNVIGSNQKYFRLKY